MTPCKKCGTLSQFAAATNGFICANCYYARRNLIERLKVAGVVLAFLLVIALGLAQPWLEARKFNKFNNGPKATYWDALFGSLRVISK